MKEPDADDGEIFQCHYVDKCHHLDSIRHGCGQIVGHDNCYCCDAESSYHHDLNLEQEGVAS